MSTNSAGAHVSPSGFNASRQLSSERQTLQEAEDQLEAQKAQLAALACRLKDELRPELKTSNEALLQMRKQHTSSKEALENLPLQRLQAAEKVGSVTKHQLAEIKGLLRSPPDPVRRSLGALWLLLHVEKFHGKSAVHFEQQKDWPRCQRMLGDENFISRILHFDHKMLDEAPLVAEYVRTQFFGHAPQKSHGDGVHHSEATAAVTSSPMRRTTSNKGGVTLPRISSGPQKVVLDEEAVSRASAPCGALYHWMWALLQEHAERLRLLVEIRQLEEDMKKGEARIAKAEGDTATCEASIARLRSTLAETQEILQRLRREEAEALKAVKDIQKLDAMGTPKSKAKTALPSRTREAEPPQPERVELEVSSTLAVIEQQLANLRIDFDRGRIELLEGNSQQAVIMPKIADLLKEHKGRLKFLIEGHREEDEEKGTDLERSLAVYQWLVEVAGAPPGLLRLKGRGSTHGLGRCAVPVPIQELVVRIGPLNKDVASAVMSARPGLYFQSKEVGISLETQAIINEMAKWLCDEEATVRIEGHADKSEPVDIALERARVVRDAFIACGVSSSQLRPETCKDLHPLSRRHAALNQRVEVHLD